MTPMQNSSRALASDSPRSLAWEPEASSTALSARRQRGVLAGIASSEWGVGLACLVIDVVSWILIYGTTSYFRRDLFFVVPFEFVLVYVIQVAVICQALFMIGGYDRNNDKRALTYTAEHILAIIGAAAISSLIVYSAAAYDVSIKPSRGVVLLSFLVFLPWSILYRRAIQAFVAESTAHRAFLVIGDGELAQKFYEAYRQSPNRQRLEFVGLDRERVGQHIAGSGSPVIEADLQNKLSNLSNRYSGVVVAEQVDRIPGTLLEHLVRTQFQRTRVYTLESFYEAHWRHVPIHSIDPFWPLQMGFQLARNSPYHYLKRLFDMAFSAFLLVLLSPLLLALFVIVWIEGGWPPIFRQSRVGREGELFTAFKFRTMRALESGSEESSDIYTRAGDPRVTPVGHWLRKLRLDELPQLFNVLRGDMSLIGPRAEWIKCAERYERNIPFYHFRHLVKPGITGWAQVNYPYGESDQDAIEKLKYDLYYIRHYSLTLDAMIVLKTVHTVLFGKGR
ncbi:MAG TPA: exopolysaccharide biosynthesis polyprenyl glycosylphosphotransferase [Chthoniobacterales bacterium]|jgi:exopolysaccharide biosynthesis polyprenyl glycosylphosphotransferase|nr:exopolysaccharide biosynthesis polyprenyl glycosylphosphotransferase [Chthoniobacterales bacterium]